MPKTTRIFSGDKSRELWKDINSVNPAFYGKKSKPGKAKARKVQAALYHLGCKCQELEALVEKQGELIETLLKDK